MCGQRSSRAAESKRRALGNYFPERIFSRNSSRAGSTQFCFEKFRLSPVQGCAWTGNSGWGLAQLKKMWEKVFFGELSEWTLAECEWRAAATGLKPRAQEKWKTSARRLLSRSHAERWSQVCRVKITFESLLTICFVSTTTNLMKCLVNWIPLNTHVRFEQTPTLPWKQLPFQKNEIFHRCRIWWRCVHNFPDSGMWIHMF